MKITWDWSLLSEVTRLGEVSANVSSGFYHLHHFLPLPYKPNSNYTNSSHHVYLPDLPYASIPNYWKTVSKVTGAYPLPYFPKLYPQIEQMLTQLDLIPLTLTDLKSTTETYLPALLDWLHSTFPSMPLPNNFLIHPTYFGTLGSYSWDKQGQQVILYLRQDQDFSTLAELVLSSILRPHLGKTLYTDWEKTEYLVDYLLLESSLRNLLPSSPTWKPTTIPPHYPQSLIQESATFLEDIGVLNHSFTHFSVQNNVIYFGSTALSSLSSREQLIMTGLITKAPTPLSTDEIADLIFTNENKFSLAAINKTIERLRTKLTKLGISSSYLATASGVGYYLKN